MTTTCPTCNAIAPADAAFCPNCGRRIAAGDAPGTPNPPPGSPPPPPPPPPLQQQPPGPQWQQQSQSQQPWPQTQSQWQLPPSEMQRRTSSGWVPWLIGCSVILVLCFGALVIIGLILSAAATQPTHQQQRHTTRRASYDGARAMKIISWEVRSSNGLASQSRSDS
jgi:hypothetical protein